MADYWLDHLKRHGGDSSSDKLLKSLGTRRVPRLMVGLHRSFRKANHNDLLGSLRNFNRDRTEKNVNVQSLAEAPRARPAMAPDMMNAIQVRHSSNEQLNETVQSLAEASPRSRPAMLPDMMDSIQLNELLLEDLSPVG